MSDEYATEWAAADQEGSATLDELRVKLSRAARRRQAYATADAG
jgi:hypothetical protein